MMTDFSELTYSEKYSLLSPDEIGQLNEHLLALEAAYSHKEVMALLKTWVDATAGIHYYLKCLEKNNEM